MHMVFSIFPQNQFNIKFKFTHPNRQIFGRNCDNKTTIPEDVD